jgi:hypothetical protein
MAAMAVAAKAVAKEGGDWGGAMEVGGRVAAMGGAERVAEGEKRKSNSA